MRSKTGYTSIDMVIGPASNGADRAWRSTTGSRARNRTSQGYTYTQEQLDQLLAPIALYPDTVLSQILMASTYPLEVVEADRWLKQNPNLSVDALDEALKDKPWDVSVKSLCHFPQVLSMMDEKLPGNHRHGKRLPGPAGSGDGYGPEAARNGRRRKGISSRRKIRTWLPRTGTLP